MAIELDDIYAARARIRGGTDETPLRASPWLESQHGAVYLKLEIVQPTGSYKIRGAWNVCARLKEQRAEADLRLITASAGNHGQGLACAALSFGYPLTVFASSQAPRTKLDAMRFWKADLRLCRDYDEAERHAKAYAAEGHGLYISPYSHPDVIAGAGTIALELIDQHPHLDAVVVPVGGGGLISGIGIAMKALSPTTRVVGVEVLASCPFTTSLAAGRLVAIDVKPSLADGLTGNLDPDTITLDIVRHVVDEIVVVGEPALRSALTGMISHEHLLIEGAAAAGPAAFLSGKYKAAGNVAVILTGANIDVSVLADVLRSSLA